MTYSLDFRRKVLKIRTNENLSMAQVAKRFDIGLASVMRWSTNPEAKTKRNKQATSIDMEALKNDVEKYPDSYLRERAKRLNVSHNCVWHALKRLNVTYKKKSPASKGGSRKAIYILRTDSRAQGKQQTACLP
jgi:transposase